MTTQTTQTHWHQDADWLEQQVRDCQVLCGRNRNNSEMSYQLRTAVRELDTANGMVISYAVSVQNLAKYTIENVQAGQRVHQTPTDACNELTKMVEKRQQCVQTLHMLLAIAMPMPVDANAGVREIIKDSRYAIVETICNNAAQRTLQA